MPKPKKRQAEKPEQLKVPRPKRQRAEKPEQFIGDGDVGTYKAFSVEETKGIYEAIKRFPKFDIDNIQKYVPSRTKKECQWYVDKVLLHAKENYILEVDCPRNAKPAPIQVWIQTMEDLMDREADYAYVLPQVLSVAANLEPHANKRKHTDPDYSLLYRYLVAILRRDPLPSLPAIESAVILDLLQSLADQLKELDTADQHRLMQLKYDLLNTKVDINNRSLADIAVKRALEEDLLETEKEKSGEGISLDDDSLNQPRQNEEHTEQEETSSNVEAGGVEEAPIDDSQPGPSTASDDVQNDSQESKSKATFAKKYGRPWRKHMSTKGVRKGQAKCTDPRPKRTPLYSLNPLCIPVKYLKPKKVSK